MFFSQSVFSFVVGLCLFSFANNVSILVKEPLIKSSDLKNKSKSVENKLSYDMIKPPEHLEAVKMERNGRLNRKFRKEVLLGDNSANGMDEQLLSSIHKKADRNGDGLLDQEELEIWMTNKVAEHFQKAVRENFLIFTSLDKNHNGLVNWDEYHTDFMINQGYNKSFAKKHPENHKHLKRKVKEKILLDKAAWSEAANTDPDALNIDEFLTFRHPEHSHVSLLNMVNDIMASLDNDGDEKLSEKEFSEVPDNEETNASLWKEQRIQEFRERIDINKDGKVSREELLVYNDPQNPIHSKIEAQKLIALADVNNDGVLSLQEVLAKKDSFLGSKMVDTAHSFHDEF